MKKNAVEHFQSKRSPTPLSLLLQKPWLPMILSCQLQESSPSNGELRHKIKEKAHQKNYMAAVNLLNQLIGREPDSAIDYNNRGLMYLQLGEYEQAMADFNWAIALNPQLDRAYNNRANCQAMLGNLDKAIADYEIALDLNPYNQRVWINQGITLRELGEYELALETFEIALVIAEQYQGRIYAERGHTLHLNGDWNWAIADYQRALSYLSPRDPYHQKVTRWLAQLVNG